MISDQQSLELPSPRRTKDSVADVRILLGKFEGNFIVIPGEPPERRDITLTGGEADSSNNTVRVSMFDNTALDGDGRIVANRAVDNTDPSVEITPTTNEVAFFQSEASLKKRNEGFVTVPDPDDVTFLGP